VERYLLICALAIAVVGAVNDVRGARIPNWLTYSGLLSALVVRFSIFGWAGLRGGFAGLLLAGGIFYFLFLLGGMGGGDVKLMAAVGAWAGTKQAISILGGCVSAGAGADFHLQAGSPLKGAGTTLTEVVNDYYGTSRVGAAYSIGAAQ